uniref:rRNA N-glycosylase n=1 Tax=Leersia perrieri TaxID=77586 RepID=A0A0D9VXN9_9ORYZ
MAINNSHVVLLLFGFVLNLTGHQGEVLSAGQRKHPSRDDLIILKLDNGDGDWTKLAMHRHDVSFAGFTNRTNHWHAFRGVGDDVIPNATRLPFRNTYRDLIGGLDNVPDLPLGKASSRGGDDGDEAVGGGAFGDVHRYTAAEADQGDGVGGVAGWEGEAHVKAEHLPYIEHWDTMSFEVIRWDRTGVWDGPFTELLRKRANTRSAEEALAITSLLANRTFPQLLLAHSHSA